MRYVPLEKVDALEAAIAAEIRDGTWTQRRDALAVALGLHGLRVGEITRASRDDLHVPEHRLHIATFKRGKPRDVPLHHSIVAALLEWRTDSLVPWLLFTRQGRQVHRTHLERAANRLFRQVLGEPLKFHSLRHTFAMRLYAAKPDVFLVQRMLGHHSVKSTEVYASSLAAVPEACLVRIASDRTAAPPPLKLFVG
jgi:integrase